MKNINQFDFPSKQTHTYKNNHYELHSDSKDKQIASKIKYKQNLQYHMEKQRNLVKQNQKNKKIQESQRKKKQLQSELQKKKRELMNLQVLKQRAQQNQKKSFQLALQKQQEDRIKREQKLLRKQQFDEEAVNRFGQAIKRMNEEKQMASFKERLADQRRKTAQQFEKIERAKANQYKNEVQERQKKQKEEKQAKVQFYQRTIRTFSSNPNPDYNRSCLHNLKIVPEKKQPASTAYQRGNTEWDHVRQKSEQRAKRLHQLNQRSKQRGKQALLRIQREKELQQFQKQSLEQQKEYNLERIQAGKKNQFVGMKPTTLSQMQQNKQQRSEQQFTKMFFPNQFNQNNEKPVSKYEIVENKMKSTKIEKPQTQQKVKKMTKNKVKQESQYANVSEGKYSFEEPEYSEFKSQYQVNSRLRQNQDQYEHENENQIQDQNIPQQAYLKNSLKQTRIPEEKERTNQINKANINNKMHSSGEKELVRENKQKMEKQRPKSAKNEQFETFNADKLLQKYGLKNEVSRSKGQKQVGKGRQKEESKRKVVELANICQNKKPEKEELSYSSESQEDSLS